VNELPSPALTRRFLVLCEQYGSERLAVQIVAVGRSTGVEGLPASVAGAHHVVGRGPARGQLAGQPDAPRVGGQARPAPPPRTRSLIACA
jgi:hypothetical protein